MKRLSKEQILMLYSQFVVQTGENKLSTVSNELIEL